MRILSLTISVLILVLLMAARRDDSPHGSELEINCNVCHSPIGWELDPKVYSFDHNTTKLPLLGQHTSINCKLCHPTLIFSDARTECFTCHTDMHNQTVGLDCERCHTAESWIVNNISEIHQQGRFPLNGPHLLADCMDCHPSASLLRFEPLNIECIDCHLEDYNSAINPNHVLGNISTDCLECHSMLAFSWTGAGFDHTFFPLTQGHKVDECNSCHTSNDYSDISSACYSCHQEDYAATTNPNHMATQISSECLECHTTLPGWKPAEFIMHETIFPLTQGHAINDCALCHSVDDYSNISAECISCHQADYNNTINPNHITAALSMDCLECHTTLPGWKPADFPVHDAQFFPINSGKHQGEWNTCADCHTSTNWSVFSCIDCHEHNRNDMDDKHSGEPTYQYNSMACLECHPMGIKVED